MLAAEGTRTIVVDRITYRWKVRRRPTYSQGLGWSPLSYAVERTESASALLIVTVPWAHPGNWVGMESAAVRPAMVAEAVRAAQHLGWRPEPGPAFVFASSGNRTPP